MYNKYEFRFILLVMVSCEFEDDGVILMFFLFFIFVEGFGMFFI